MVNYHYKDGQTPIDADEKADLIPYLTTLDELNLFEQENIIEAQKWLLTTSLKNIDIFDANFLKKLHQKMFDRVWKWAGTFRKSNKNIGCEFYQIPTEIKNLQDDALFWLENKTYKMQELALVYHHRLVKIHLFANGNGRHARIMADVIIKKFQGKALNWQNISFKSFEDFRKEYISCLRKADKGDYQNLFQLLITT